MNDVIKDYEFKRFDHIEPVNKKVDDFEFQEFEGESVYGHDTGNETLSVERESAIKSNFQVSPIVREHRGHSEQERQEKERRIEDEVQKRVDKVKEAAYQDGYREGLDIGKEEVFQQLRADVEEKLASLNELIQEALATREDILTKQKHDIGKIVRNFTKWIVLRELKSDEGYIERLLEKLIVEIQTKSNLLIQVNQEVYEKMPDVIDHIQKKLGELKNVRVEVDYDIKDQGIILESENGIINGTLNQQFKNLDQLFKSVGIEAEDNEELLSAEQEAGETEEAIEEAAAEEADEVDAAEPDATDEEEPNSNSDTEESNKNEEDDEENGEGNE